MAKSAVHIEVHVLDLEEELLLKGAPDLVEACEGANEMEDIYISEIQRIAGPDVELSEGAQSRLHELRQKRYRAIGKVDRSDRTTSCPYCLEEMVRTHYQNEEGAWIMCWLCGCEPWSHQPSLGEDA